MTGDEALTCLRSIDRHGRASFARLLVWRRRNIRGTRGRGCQTAARSGDAGGGAELGGSGCIKQELRSRRWECRASAAEAGPPAPPGGPDEPSPSASITALTHPLFTDLRWSCGAMRSRRYGAGARRATRFKIANRTYTATAQINSVGWLVRAVQGGHHFSKRSRYIPDRRRNPGSITLGDVWLCSGQSNMKFAGGLNAAAEIAAMRICTSSS